MVLLEKKRDDEVGEQHKEVIERRTYHVQLALSRVGFAPRRNMNTSQFDRDSC